MKSLRKLRSLVQHTSKSKVTSSHVKHTEDLEDIVKGMQKLHEMRLCYEKLHAASSSVVNHAYGFSQAIQEMGTCLMDDFAFTDDADNRNMCEMVGRVQLEIAKTFDHYAKHVSETLTMPTESVLNEIKAIDETKNQSDEKRHIYDTLRMRAAKGRLKSKKDEPHICQNLEEAKEQFDELCVLIGCRLLSLEQGHPRSLLMQAAYHHASQMHLFRNGLASLREIEAHVKQIIKARHLDETLCFRDGTVRSWDLDFGVRNVSTLGENETGDSSSESSLEKVTYVSKERFSCGNSAGTKTVTISPTRLPNMDEVEKVRGQTKHSVSTSIGRSSCPSSDLFRASPSSLFPASTNMATPSASEKIESRTYHSHLEIPVEDKHKLHVSLQLPSLQNNIESVASSERTAAENSPSRIGMELLIESRPMLLPEPSSSILTHVGHPKEKKKLPSFKFHTSFLCPSSHSSTGNEKSSQFSVLSKKLRHQETFKSRNRHIRGELFVPNSGPLPRRPIDLEIDDPLYKSGPLHWSNCTSNSPEISPPHVNQPHKLPPPPLHPVFNNSATSDCVAYSAPLYKEYHEPFSAGFKIAAPLPPPPLDTIKANVCVYNRRPCNPVHSRSPTCPEALLTKDYFGSFQKLHCRNTESNSFVHVAEGSS